MSEVKGTVLKRITSSDRQHYLDVVARSDGLFEFRAYSFERDEYASGYWAPSQQSGVYDRPELAEADARTIVSWMLDTAGTQP
jgi:hypothetical protein